MRRYQNLLPFSITCNIFTPSIISSLLFPSHLRDLTGGQLSIKEISLEWPAMPCLPSSIGGPPAAGHLVGSWTLFCSSSAIEAMMMEVTPLMVSGLCWFRGAQQGLGRDLAVQNFTRLFNHGMVFSKVA